MAQKNKSNVDVWLARETDQKREALEIVSGYFDGADALTVNTLEAVYGQESSFGINRGERGSSGPAGDFQLTKVTAERYGLIVSKKNDQRFDINYASSAAARYLKDLDNMFSNKTALARGIATIPVKNASERKNFVLAAYNGGKGTIARAQRLVERSGEDPQTWDRVKSFLIDVGVKKNKIEEIRQYIENILTYETEFAEKSTADKSAKNKKGRRPGARCTEGHWITKDDRHIFICD